MVIHENAVASIVDPNSYTKKYYSGLHRQKGERDLFLGTQKRGWLEYLQERRAKKEEHILNNSENIQNKNLINIKTLNTSGPEWTVAPGETVYTNVPKNLRPVRTVRRTRKGGKRSSTRKHRSTRKH